MNILTKNQKKILEEVYNSDDYICFPTENFSKELREHYETESDIHYLARYGFLEIINKSLKRIVAVRLLNRGVDKVDPNLFESKRRRKGIVNEVYNNENRDDLFMVSNLSYKVRINDKQLRYDIKYLINEGVCEDKHESQSGFAAITLTDYGKRSAESKKIWIVIYIILVIAGWFFQDFIVSAIKSVF